MSNDKIQKYNELIRLWLDLALGFGHWELK